LTEIPHRTPWSLLNTAWLDVPIGTDAGGGSATWGDFCQSFDACLHTVSIRFARRVDDRAHLERLVTAVLVDNLGILASKLGESDKIQSICQAADRLLVPLATPLGIASRWEYPRHLEPRAAGDQRGRGARTNREPGGTSEASRIERAEDER
jgi:hypothetical protein